MLNTILSPIAVIDSGIGGLKLLKKLRAEFPCENYLYYADYAYMPYGNKSKATIIKRVDDIINLLIEKYHVKMVILACNTASITSISSLKRKFKIPIFGVLPRVYGKNSLVLATKLTAKLIDENLNSYFLKNSEKRNLSDVKIIGIKNLASFIEENFYDKQKITKKLLALEKIYNISGYKYVTLGCTHYEYISPLFKQAFKDVTFISPINRTISEIRKSKILLENSEKKQGDIFMLSSSNYKSMIDKLYLAYRKL